MNQRVKLIEFKDHDSSSSEGGYVKSLVRYLVMDDLSFYPILSIISGVTLLYKLNLGGFAELEEKVVEVGVNEGLELFKASIQSKTVLTDALLRKQKDQADGEFDVEASNTSIP